MHGVKHSLQVGELQVFMALTTLRYFEIVYIYYKPFDSLIRVFRPYGRKYPTIHKYGI